MPVLRYRRDQGDFTPDHIERHIEPAAVVSNVTAPLPQPYTEVTVTDVGASLDDVDEFMAQHGWTRIATDPGDTLDDVAGDGLPSHATSHSDGSTDEITVENLATGSTNTAFVLSPDGLGGLVMRAEAGGGESNTASNVNTGGVGVFKQKVGVDLEFRGINALEGVQEALDAATNEIRVRLDINGLTADATPDTAADYLATYDADAGSHKKVLIDDMLAAGSGSIAGNLFGEHCEDDPEDSTTSTTFVEKLTCPITTTAASADYLILYHAVLDAAGNAKYEAQVEEDDTTQIADFVSEGSDKNNTFAGHAVRTLTAGAHQYDIDFRKVSGGSSVSIKQARIAVWRIS